MFDNLSDKLNSVFKKLKGHGKLTEKNIEEGLREVRMALLEADVHYAVVKKFINDIKQRALGQEVMASLTPGQQIIKIVNDELTKLMGSRHEGLSLSGPLPISIMLVGLQGSGKTTTAGKLSIFLKKPEENHIWFRWMFTDRLRLISLESWETNSPFRCFHPPLKWIRCGFAVRPG